MNIDWQKVNRVLVVRLRSIGDTVLSTPSLIALRRFLPNAKIDVLLEDWVAPALEGFEAIDDVLTVSRSDAKSRAKIALQLRRNKYDVVFNLHGGTTSAFLVRATGAIYRVGYKDYSYSFLHNILLPPATEFWNRPHTHSAEQQLALLGYTGVPVEDKPASSLAVTKKALRAVESKIDFGESKFALIHPVAATETKQWATENLARAAEYLSNKGFQIIAVATPKERETLEKLKALSKVPIQTLTDLSLPEIIALASQASFFLGNDSGIAHIAAAVKTPSVVLFGSSNINHWRPWADAPSEIVYSDKECSHWTGGIHKGLEDPKCIFCVEIKDVIEAIEKVVSAK